MKERKPILRQFLVKKFRKALIKKVKSKKTLYKTKKFYLNYDYAHNLDEKMLLCLYRLNSIEIFI